MTKIWSGGAAEEGDVDLSEIMTAEDNRVDSRLVRYEILGLIAYHLELALSNVIKKDDSSEILRSLLALLNEDFMGEGSYEDVHSAVESKVNEKTESGKNLRLFISRNEQSHTDIRSFYLDVLLDISKALAGIAEEAKKISVPADGYMAGYTHNRQAMPVSFSTYLDYISASFADASEEALVLFNKQKKTCPFGYGSGYGSPVKVDFNAVALRLGYDGTFSNPVLEASRRGLDDLDISFLIARIMTLISRISQDFMNYSSDESAILDIPPGFSTGSSLMPNKRNPDYLEMLQGYCAEAVSGLSMAASILANRSTGYHREFQLSKDRTMESAIMTLKILKTFTSFIGRISFSKEESARKLLNSTFATDTAMDLFNGGTGWKDAYLAVGEKLKKGEMLAERYPPVYCSAVISTVHRLKGRVEKLKSEREELFRRLVEDASGFLNSHQ